MLTCNEIAGLVASEDGTTSGWRRRLGMWVHLLMCKTCRRYKAQVEAISAAARQRRESPPDDDALELLQDRIFGEDSSEKQK